MIYDIISAFRTHTERECEISIFVEFTKYHQVHTCRIGSPKSYDVRKAAK